MLLDNMYNNIELPANPDTNGIELDDYPVIKTKSIEMSPKLIVIEIISIIAIWGISLANLLTYQNTEAYFPQPLPSWMIFLFSWGFFFVGAAIAVGILHDVLVYRDVIKKGTAYEAVIVLCEAESYSSSISYHLLIKAKDNKIHVIYKPCYLTYEFEQGQNVVVYAYNNMIYIPPCR